MRSVTTVASLVFAAVAGASDDSSRVVTGRNLKSQQEAKDALASYLYDRAHVLWPSNDRGGLDRATLLKGASAGTLSSKTIADGKYLLCERPQKPSTGRSTIYRGYLSDGKGNPTGNQLVIKVADDFEAMSRESKNYDKVASGLFSGKFVRKIEYVPELNSVYKTKFDVKSAVVMEAGEQSLKDIVAEKGGLDGGALRDAAKAAAECIQAAHSSGLVWTDLKTSNFVKVGSQVKGIDLESAMPRLSYPVDFSPEGCPPEVARAYNAGNRKVTLDFTYDIWSYGMYLYEIATGRPYFGKSGPDQITKALASPDFATDGVDVSAVQDSKLRDLISQCLNTDPKKRPGILQVVLHPYLTGFR